MWSAAAEPFLSYDPKDAILNIGIGSVLIAFWIAWSIWVVGLIAFRALSAWWLFGLILSTVCGFYLLSCPFGYLHDLEQFIMPNYQAR